MGETYVQIQLCCLSLDKLMWLTLGYLLINVSHNEFLNKQVDLISFPMSYSTLKNSQDHCLFYMATQ